MQQIWVSKNSEVCEPQNCWVAAFSQHPEFMSALWMQAGKQQTASQQSGSWSRTVTRIRSQKWLFVVAGNTATFPNVKWAEIFFFLFLTSSLSVRWDKVDLLLIIFSLDVSVSERETHTVLQMQTHLINAGGMSLFITWSSVVWTVSFPTCSTHTKPQTNYH